MTAATTVSAAPRSASELLIAVERGGPAVVALSGGVDSAVMAHLARTALGARARAVTLVGPALAPGELRRAREVASSIGVEHVELSIDPLASEAYRRNDGDRCYYCRTVEAAAIRAWGEPRGAVQYLDGVHVDDLSDDRPGLRALAEARFVHPLAEAGWRKVDTRAYAREVGLPGWDQPSDACLASRIAHGTAITAELLGRVRSGEEWLLTQGFRRVRVRTDGRSARVEVDPSEVARLVRRPFAEEVVGALRGLGFAEVELDLVGYRPRPGA